MNTRIGLLGGVLAAQILILAVLLIAGGSGANEQAAGLLPFTPAQAKSLGIATADDQVRLSRSDDGWQLEDGLPADSGKVGEVLEKLAKVSAAWPVATSAASAERFEVTEENFQRRLVIASEGDETATLYLGSSPGYRRVHARADGADEVYSIDFSNYEAPADADHWLDKQLLRPSGDVVSVRKEDAWQLRLAGDATDDAAVAAADQQADAGSLAEADDGAEGTADPSADGGLSANPQADSEINSGRSADLDGFVDGTGGGGPLWLVDGSTADDEAARRLVGRFADLNVLGIAAMEGEPKASFTIQDAAGEYQLDLFFNAAEDDYSVVSSRVGGRFEIATYIAEQMLIDTDDLLPKPAEPEADDASAAADAGA